jgi:hypothetical protein
VPSDFAIAVATHPRAPDSVSAYHDTDRRAGSAGGHIGASSTENGWRLWRACNAQAAVNSETGFFKKMRGRPLPA